MYSSNYLNRFRHQFLTTILLSAGMCVLHIDALGQSPLALKPNPDAEQWVLSQITDVGEADLNKKFGKEADRVLSASFLIELLTDPSRHIEEHVREVIISNAKVAGDLFLKNEEIRYDTKFHQCYFQGEVDLSQSVFQKSLEFKGCIFNGPFDLQAATIEYYLELDDSRFIYNDHERETPDVYFRHLKVGRDMVLTFVEFAGAVNFTDAEIIGNFDAKNAKFLDAESEADFDSLKVKGHVYFHEAVFEGPTTFLNADIGKEFYAPNAQFNSKKQAANFTGMKVNGLIEFDQTSFAPSEKSPSFQGMTYRSIDIGKEKNPLNLVERSEFSPDIYETLEAFFRGIGKSTNADDVYIARRWREGELLPLYKRFWNRLLFYFAGYGRRSWYALIWSAIFLFIGCLVFSHEERMETKRPEDKDRYQDTYNPFWYSLAVMLPFVRLHDADIWMPKITRRLRGTRKITLRLWMRKITRRLRGMRKITRRLGGMRKIARRLWMRKIRPGLWTRKITLRLWMRRITPRLASSYWRIHTIVGYLLLTIGIAALIGIIK